MKEKKKGKGKEKGKRHQETKEIEGKVKKIVHALYTFVYTQNAPGQQPKRKKSMKEFRICF